MSYYTDQERYDAADFRRQLSIQLGIEHDPGRINLFEPNSGNQIHINLLIQANAWFNDILIGNQEIPSHEYLEPYIDKEKEDFSKWIVDVAAAAIRIFTGISNKPEGFCEELLLQYGVEYYINSINLTMRGRYEWAKFWTYFSRRSIDELESLLTETARTSLLDRDESFCNRVQKVVDFAALISENQESEIPIRVQPLCQPNPEQIEYIREQGGISPEQQAVLTYTADWYCVDQRKNLINQDELETILQDARNTCALIEEQHKRWEEKLPEPTGKLSEYLQKVFLHAHIFITPVFEKEEAEPYIDLIRDFREHLKQNARPDRMLQAILVVEKPGTGFALMTDLQGHRLYSAKEIQFLIQDSLVNGMREPRFVSFSDITPTEEISINPNLGPPNTDPRLN